MKSISFDAISIESIRAGKKTMTRRTVKLAYLEDGFILDAKIAVISRWAVGDEAWVKTGWIDADGKKHPAMFIKRVDSPFSIRITAHRVERVQEISSEDTTHEGVYLHYGDGYDAKIGAAILWANFGKEDKQRALNVIHEAAIEAFKRRWNGIYGKRPPYRWEDNPLVEVLTFEVIEAQK